MYHTRLTGTGDHPTDVGVEFVDGRFYRLYEGPDGTLIRGEGAGQARRTRQLARQA